MKNLLPDQFMDPLFTILCILAAIVIVTINLHTLPYIKRKWREKRSQRRKKPAYINYYSDPLPGEKSMHYQSQNLIRLAPLSKNRNGSMIVSSTISKNNQDFKPEIIIVHDGGPDKENK